MEELTKSWSCLTLLDIEGSNIQIKEEEAVTDFVLAAKFLTKRALNIDAIAKTFTPLWRSKNGFKIKKEGDHIIPFTFDNRKEIDQILEAKPWKLMFLICNFIRLLFGYRYMTSKFSSEQGRWLKKYVGRLGQQEPSKGAVMEGDGFIKVRVTIDMSQPLSQGRVISLDSGKE